MSERTTIGGVTYESVGSSSSNLLLKCNGTARIQWGTKLIDLVKNGKIASADNSTVISVVSDESDIKADGIYIIEKEKSVQLWICKSGNRYNITETDLYISASTKQDITAEQRQQALENIGMYYNTLEDVKKANIQNGIVYVLEDKTLYTVHNGTISEFEAKLKTVTVEKEEEIGEVINSSIKIVLSVLDQEYLVLEDKRITANYDIHVKDSAKVCSEGANEVRGYRLYMNGGYSYLDVDKLNVRTGLHIPEYIETTYSEFSTSIINKKLEPHRWYLIKDYQNPWKIPENDYDNDRPILVRALTTSTIYKEGQLFKDRRVIIQYDPEYNEEIALIDTSGNLTGETTRARGRIVWMKDCFNNEANFDFLNYEDALDNPLTTLHKVYEDDSLDLSIFPEGSHDNKLIVHDLKGTVLKDTVFNNDNVTEILFNCANMHNNDIECRGLYIECDNCFNNTIQKCSKLRIKEDVINSTLIYMYATSDTSTTSFATSNNNLLIEVPINYEITDSIIEECANSAINSEITSSTFEKIVRSTINYSIYESTFEVITDSTLNCQISTCIFKSLLTCIINNSSSNDAVWKNITCFGDLSNITFNPTEDKYILLYDTSKVKEVKVNSDGTLDIVSVQEQAFIRGMIIMHSGIGGIPAGWAICDGGTYKYDGVTSTTPDLRGRFIKSVISEDTPPGPSTDLDVNENNEFTITKEHLPEHNHPHKEHTHTISGTSVSIQSSGDLSMSGSYTDTTTSVSANMTSAVITAEGEGVTSSSADMANGVSESSSSESKNITVSGGSHSHTVSVTEGIISNTTSEEITSTDTDEENIPIWENKAFKIEPNYYSLIFIMKL